MEGQGLLQILLAKARADVDAQPQSRMRTGFFTRLGSTDKAAPSDLLAAFWPTDQSLGLSLIQGTHRSIQPDPIGSHATALLLGTGWEGLRGG